MRTVLVGGHTLCPILTPASKVVDAGAHRCEFSQIITERFGCRCWALEPNPD